MDGKGLSTLANEFISVLEETEAVNHDRKITVNPVVLKFATWYEKLRNAMEYREEEAILRAAIERILRRRLLLGGNAQTAAEPLVRELIWAGYIPNGTVPHSIIDAVEKSIDLYLRLRFYVLKKHLISELEINEWTYHLMSSDIEYIINPKRDKEIMSTFMFQILKDKITITDDTDETKNAQVFIGIRRAFAKDDIAFLRFHLFHQYFGVFNDKTFDHISADFKKGYEEIKKQLSYPRKEKIYTYIKRKSAAFLILEDIMQAHKGNFRKLLENEQEFENTVFTDCNIRYKNIASKVQRAIVRSVIFILFSKAIFGILIEGSYERLLYGKIIWSSMLLNTGIPPILMLIVGVMINTPNQNNSKRILSFIKMILYDEQPRLGDPLVINKVNDKVNPLLAITFSLLWGLGFIVSFGAIIFVLTKLQFNIVSQAVFVFFLAIVSFLSYRISTTAHLYTLGDSQGLFTPVIDFLFMPVIRVGRQLTEGISQINFVLIFFDLLIETPFKFIFGFIEQWFFFLHAKREELE